MPYALILVGAVALVAGIRNTYKDLWALVEGDFKGGFLAWIASIAVIGAIGYVPKLKPLSVALMTLLLVVLVLSNRGVFAQLQGFILSGAGNTGTGGNAGVQPLQPLPALSPADQVGANLGNIPNG